jgi:hypothetical protein
MKQIFYVILAVIALSLPVAAQAPMTNETVTTMTKAGLSEEVIVSSINSHSAAFKTEPSDLVALKKAGVSNKVIAAMVAKSNGVNSGAPLPAESSTVSDSGVSHQPSRSSYPMGIVAAEIGNGDLKPARFANLLALSPDLAGPVLVGIAQMKSTKEDAMRKAGSELQRRLTEIACLKGLIQVRVEILKAADAARKNSGAA